MIPKVRVGLLIVILGLWRWSWSAEEESLAIAKIRLVSPSFRIANGEHGDWKLDWPNWPERKGEPFVHVRGLPFVLHEPRPVDLRLRVDPPDSVKTSTARPNDPDGWFEAGTSWEGDTWARLTPSVSRRIEYKVRVAGEVTESWAELQIGGVRDGDLIEAATAARAACTGVALLAALPLCIWILIAFRQRWKASRT